MTKPKKITNKGVPKSIRQSVDTILKAAAKNNGIVQAGIVYLQTDGTFGVAVNGSDVFRELFNRTANDLADNLTTVGRIYHDGFHAGQDSVFHPNPAR